MKWFIKQTDYKINNKYFEILQKHWANKMADFTKDMSKKTLIILLALFVTGAGIFFGSLLYCSFKMELSRQFEVIQISKILPMNDNNK